MKDHLQIHEVFSTVPFNVEVTLEEFLVETLEIIMDILDCLLNLVVIVWLIDESTNGYEKQYSHNDDQQTH